MASGCGGSSWFTAIRPGYACCCEPGLPLRCWSDWPACNTTNSTSISYKTFKSLHLQQGTDGGNTFLRTFCHLNRTLLCSSAMAYFFLSCDLYALFQGWSPLWMQIMNIILFELPLQNRVLLVIVAVIFISSTLYVNRNFIIKLRIYNHWGLSWDR